MGVQPVDAMLRAKGQGTFGLPVAAAILTRCLAIADPDESWMRTVANSTCCKFSLTVLAALIVCDAGCRRVAATTKRDLLPTVRVTRPVVRQVVDYHHFT